MNLPYHRTTPPPPSPSPPCPVQTKNAHRRLQASLVDGRDLGPQDGGPAELQDLLRVFLSLAGCDQRDAGMFQPLIGAAMQLLPDIQAAAARKAPHAAFVAAAAAAQGACALRLGGAGAVVSNGWSQTAGTDSREAVSR